MKKISFLTKTIFIVFLLVLPVKAQIADEKPGLSLDCPKAVEAGNKILVNAKLNSKITEGISYHWSVSQGTIQSGQGTSNLEIETTDDMEENVSIYLELGGTPIYFETISANCSVELYPKPKAALLDESGYIKYEGGMEGLHHSRRILDPIVTELQKNPQSSLYIVIYAKDKTLSTKRKITGAKRELDFVLFTFHKLPPDRVQIVEDGTGKELMRYYLIPPGAENPPVEKFPETKPPQ